MLKRLEVVAFCLCPALMACGGSDEDDGSSGDDSSTGGSSQTENTSSGDTGGTDSGSGGTDSDTTSSDTGGAGGTGGGSGGGGSGGTDSSADETNTTGGTTSSTTGSSTDGGAGAPGETGEWEDVTNNLLTLAAGGFEISALTTQPETGRVLVGIGERGIFGTDDGGDTWFALGQGNGSATIPHRPLSMIFDPEDPTIFWENGIYNSQGIFFTSDNGDTFTRLGDIAHNDGLAVDFTDPERNLLLASGHEDDRRLYMSMNGGDEWAEAGDAIPDGTGFSSFPLILDSETFLLGVCGGGGKSCGVYKSIDQAESWSLVGEYSPGAMPLVASDGSIYWPLTAEQGIIVSHDDGENWSQASGPVRSRTGTAVELPDGSIVALGKDNLQVSFDHGASWEPLGAELPLPGANCGIYGVTYSPVNKAFFINANDCSGNVEYSAMYRMSYEVD